MNLSIFQTIELSILSLTTIYHPITNKIHWYNQGSGHTILIDHSLGGVEGYLLIDELANWGMW